MPPRKNGNEPTKNDLTILRAIYDLKRAGTPVAHGYLIAKSIEGGNPTKLVGYGTLYKSLGFLEEQKMVSSRWEEQGPSDSRPRRRLYEITGVGETVVERFERVVMAPVFARGF